MASPTPPSDRGSGSGVPSGDNDGLDISASGPPATVTISLTPPPPEAPASVTLPEGADAAADTATGPAATTMPALATTPQSAVSVTPATPSTPAAPPAEPVPRLSFFAFYFRHADALDLLMMFIGVIGGLVTGALIPFFQWLFGRMLDSLNTGEDLVEAVSTVAIQFAYMAVVAFVMGHLQVWGWSVYGERQVARIRGLYVKALLRQDISWYDRQTRGQMAAITTELTNSLQDGLGRKNGDIIEYMAQFVGGFVIAFMQSWKLTLVLMAAIPAVIVSAAVMASLAGRAKKKESLAYAAAGAKAYETLAAIRTVQALRLQPKVKAAYDRLLREAEKMGYSKARDNALGVGLLGFVVYSVFGLGFWYGAKLVAGNVGCDPADASCMSGGKVLSTFFAVIMGAMGLGSSFPCIAAVMQGKAAAETIFYVVDRIPAINSASELGRKLKHEEVKGEIELRDVTFAYPTRPDKLVCKGYNLKIEAGKTYALCGPSGEGKSTIMSLVLRFYDPLAGDVLLDGASYKELNVKSLRASIGYVGQEPVLFSASIRENIRSGKPDATDAEVEAAARMANAHDFIASFPAGYDTSCGEGGLQLSGGQKQRIAIARALIKEPAILLLDEATSALDNKSERVVQAALDKLMAQKKRTTIVIAHRLSTIRNADVICFVKDGKVVEHGSHEELMALKGHYAQLVAAATNDHDEEDASAEEEVPAARVPDAATVEKEEAAAAEAELGKSRRWSLSRRGSLTKSLHGRRPSLLQAMTTVPDIETNDVEGQPGKPVPASKLLWKLALEEWDMLLLGLLGSVVNGAGFPLLGWLISRSQTLFYYLDPNRVREEGAFYGIMFVMLGVVICAARFAQEYGLGVMSERLARKLRGMAFGAMVRQQISWFDKEENSTGALTTRLADDAAQVNRVLGNTLGQLLQLVFCLAFALGLGFSASWQMALLVLATLPFQIVGRIVAQQQMRGEQSEGSTDKGSSAGAVLSAAVLGIRTVAAFSLEAAMHAKYELLYASTLRTRLREAFKAGLLMGYTQAIQNGTNGLIFWVAGLLIKAGEANFEQVMQAVMVLMLGTSGLAMALKSLGDSRGAGAGANRVAQLIWGSTRQSIDAESEQGERLKEFKGEVEFEGVYFTYPNRPKQPIYGSDQFPKGLQLHINPGETVALVGPSGGGKSTTLQLLMRFYDPTPSGRVLFDGVDLRTLNVKWARSQIAYVGQEPVLFQGSIYENIANGKADGQVTEAEVIEAAKLAQIHEFVSSLPEGYQTRVDEGSVNLSGGQKQRIAIARACISDPPILLLDEATAALDNENEHKVQEALEKLQESKKRTTLIVAHRLSTIENADRIVCIGNGGVLEQGTHKELLAIPNGVYASLAKQAH